MVKYLVNQKLEKNQKNTGDFLKDIIRGKILNNLIKEEKSVVSGLSS